MIILLPADFGLIDFRVKWLWFLAWEESRYLFLALLMGGLKRLRDAVVKSDGNILGIGIEYRQTGV